jgi:hypothetical protein
VTRASARDVAAVAGGVLLAIGLLGFIPTVTTHFGNLAFGRGSGATLIGIFRVSVLLNLVHALLGAAGLVLARTHMGAVAFLTAGGIALLALCLIGAAKVGSWLSLGTADDWLHLVLGLALLVLAYVTAAPS